MDCLVCIFERLGLEDLILGVPLVCKSWYEASSNPLCWKSLNFAQLDLHPSSHFVGRFKQQYQIEKFSFTTFLKFMVNRSCRSVAEIVLPSLDVTFVLLEDLDCISKEYVLTMLPSPTLIILGQKSTILVAKIYHFLYWNLPNFTRVTVC